MQVQGLTSETNTSPSLEEYSNKSFREIVSPLIAHGGVVFTTPKGVLKHNTEERLTPASILKIATASAALKILGKNHRFKTAFYQDNNNDIYIKGYGDPFLTSEEISLIWLKLSKQNVHSFPHLYIDNSFFDLDSVSTDGANNSHNPYDSFNSSVAVNFNTIPLRIKNKTISSLEKQTPTIPLMKKYAPGLSNGKHRIAISKYPQDLITYAGEIFIALAPKKISSDKVRITQKDVPKYLSPMYVHQSTKSLEEIIEAMLLYSNNFIANQLFLACGSAQYGTPATWEKGKQALDSFLLNELHLDPSQFSIKEGSGLSRQNKLSANAMITILTNFQPMMRLLPRKSSIYVKSGTLTGVYSYAGYTLQDNSYWPFVIMLNQPKNTRDPLLNKIQLLLQ